MSKHEIAWTLILVSAVYFAAHVIVAFVAQ